jgi:NDP-sugar pyrophosphorylase family protein
LQEFTALGTAGGIHHFRDQIRCGNPEAFFVMNGDVCADFPLAEMLSFREERGEAALVTMMATEATAEQSLHYGCIVQVIHITNKVRILGTVSILIFLIIVVVFLHRIVRRER